MAEKIVAIRPTAQTANILRTLKKENPDFNVNKYINDLILAAEAVRISDYKERVRFIPESHAELYESKTKGTVAVAKAHSVPLSQLSMRKYVEAMKTVQEDGLDRFYFRVNENETYAFISTSREEASMEFTRLFVRDPSAGSYVRTSVPLPQMRYDAANKTVIIFSYE